MKLNKPAFAIDEKQFISKISSPKTHVRYSILKGISSDRIRQLIIYTKKDKLIKTYTHDSDSFKSKKTFTSWQKRRKTIYTLVTGNGKLVGIIWFCKKHFDKYKFTMAIRTYPPARGKRVSKKFANEVLKHFKNRHTNPHFWVKILKINIRGIKLYKRLGFKNINNIKRADEVVMTLDC